MNQPLAGFVVSCQLGDQYAEPVTFEPRPPFCCGPMLNWMGNDDGVLNTLVDDNTGVCEVWAVRRTAAVRSSNATIVLRIRRSRRIGLDQVRLDDRFELSGRGDATELRRRGVRP